MIQLAFLGALIGLPSGYALQRTILCFNCAYRKVFLHRRTVLLRLIGLALLIQLIGFALLIQFNVGGVSLNIVLFYLIAAMLGGFICGLSMVYAYGCSSTVWYWMGNGEPGTIHNTMGVNTWLGYYWRLIRDQRIPLSKIKINP